MRTPFLFLLLAGLILFSVPNGSALAHDKLYEKFASQGLVITQAANMAPMSFIGINGEPSGYIIDLWRKWSAETGIPVHFLLLDWPETLKAVQNGQADVHGGLFFSKEQNEFLQASQPFFSSRGALFVRNDLDVSSVADLDGALVGVIENGFYSRLLLRDFPKIKSVPIKTTSDIINAAASGEIYAFIGDYPPLMYQICSQGKNKDFRVLQCFGPQRFRAAVGLGNSDLLHVIRSGLARIDEGERQTIMGRWIIDEGASTTDWIVPTALLCTLSLLIALMVPFIYGRFQK